MTLLAAASLKDARRPAEQDNRSVIDGVLTIAVRPRNVRMDPIATS